LTSSVRLDDREGSVVEARTRVTFGVWLPLFISSLITALGGFLVVVAAFSQVRSMRCSGSWGSVRRERWCFCGWRGGIAPSRRRFSILRDAAGLDED
jgi:hypothetical protein